MQNKKFVSGSGNNERMDVVRTITDLSRPKEQFCYAYVMKNNFRTYADSKYSFDTETYAS